MKNRIDDLLNELDNWKSDHHFLVRFKDNQDKAVVDAMEQVNVSRQQCDTLEKDKADMEKKLKDSGKKLKQVLKALDESTEELGLLKKDKSSALETVSRLQTDQKFEMEKYKGELECSKMEQQRIQDEFNMFRSEIQQKLQPLFNCPQSDTKGTEVIPQVLSSLQSSVSSGIDQGSIQSFDYTRVQSYASMTAKQKALEEELHEVQKRYQDLVRDHNRCIKPPDDLSEDKETLSVDANEINIADLQEEIGHLYRTKTDLENEIISLKTDNQEIEGQIKEREEDFKIQKEELQCKVSDFQRLVETISQAKENLETDLITQREEFKVSLSKARSESLAKHIRCETERDEIVSQMSEAEKQLSGVRDKSENGTRGEGTVTSEG